MIIKLDHFYYRGQYIDSIQFKLLDNLLTNNISSIIKRSLDIYLDDLEKEEASS